ncbi:hypothetical protein D1BOALGB6SA_1808 [Olavius sp. associated proteobacterium Delta 1]|nr:hypothetical protein D1BOALGB6SA_1808 [Olavius sp. associated proteobacterium Delta 1]
MTDEKRGQNLTWSLRKTLWILLALITAGTVVLAQPESNFIVVGQFSTASPGNTLPDGWNDLTFKKIDRHTRYTLVQDTDRVVVKAVSEQSASAITKNIKIDPKEYPIIDWQWKVANILSRGDVFKKKGDDFPARVYITFEYDSSLVGILDKVKYTALRSLLGRYPPLGVITYIWGSKAPVETMVMNSFSDQVAMFVVRSGSGNLNTWLKERRNVYEDYKKAFGKEPPMISGIAIMSDSDNTHESATAYFGDIIFRKK